MSVVRTVVAFGLGLLVAPDAFAAPRALVVRDSVWFWSDGCPNPSGGATEQELIDQGVTTDVLTPAAFATADLYQYTMIFLADCQTDPSYNAWNARLADLDAWVSSGGFMAVHATRNCSTNSVQPQIPGGTPTRVDITAPNGDVVGVGSPIVAGLPAVAVGSSLAHDRYTSTGNPTDTVLIEAVGSNDVLLFERVWGNGLIVYGGLTYECYQATCGYCGPGDAGEVLANEVAHGSTFDLCGSTDFDNDGVNDSCDACPGFDDNLDADADGVPDDCDACPDLPAPDDIDADGICDDVDDSDGDGVVDYVDVCPKIADPGQADADADGLGDACDPCPNSVNLRDSDGDGAPDDCDRCPGEHDSFDADGDEVPDGCDRCEGEDDTLDADGDGWPDACDVCPGDLDPHQIDKDEDGFGSACDCDDDVAAIHPGATERCNHVDDDCDGTVDGPNVVDGLSWYPDADRDGDGDSTATPIVACDPIPGHVVWNGDCNDDDALIHSAGREECDDIDQNCDGDPLVEGCPELARSAGCGCSAVPSGAGLGLALFLALPLAVARRARQRAPRQPWRK